MRAWIDNSGHQQKVVFAIESHMQKLPLTIVVLVILEALFWAARADAADVIPFFERTRAGLVAISHTVASGRRSACSGLVADAFDVGSVASSVATAGNWNVMAAPTRQTMRKAIAARLAKECVTLLERADPGGARIERVRERPEGVKMTVLAPDRQGNDRVIVWTLRRDERGDWRALDLAIDGRSAVASLRQEFENAVAAEHGSMSEAAARFLRTSE